MREEPFAIKVKNEQIVGMVHYGKENFPIAIICHGWAAHRFFPEFLLDAAREMSKKGINVIRFDFRGTGESQGKWEDQTITSMLEDLDAIINFAKGKFENDKICLVGHSQGAYVAFLKAARDKRVKCLVSWMGRMWDIEDSIFIINEYKRKGYVYTRYAIISRKYIQDSLKYKLKEDIKNIKVPTLFIYGEKDDWTYPSSCFEIFNKLQAKKKLLILEDLDHHFNGKDSKKLLKETIKWIIENCK